MGLVLLLIPFVVALEFARDGLRAGGPLSGLTCCAILVAAGIPLGMLGLWLDWGLLAALGCGAVVVVFFGWPIILLMGGDWGHPRR